MQQNVKGSLKNQPPQGASFADYLQGKLPIPPFLYPKRKMEFMYQYTFTNLPSSGVSGNDKSVQLDKDAHFLWEGLSVTGLFPASTQKWGETTDLIQSNIHIYNLSYGDAFSNIATWIRDVSGPGFNAQYFKDPTLLAPATILRIVFGELGQVTTAGPIQITLYGRKVYGVTDEEYALSRKRQWFVYNCPIPQTGTAGVFPVNNAEIISRTQVFSDADFVCRRISAASLYRQILAMYGNSHPTEVIFNIRLTGTGRSFFNKKINLRTITGGFLTALNNTPTVAIFSPARPFTMPCPLFIPRNSVLEFRAEQSSATTEMTGGTVALEGFKVFT